MPGSGGVPLACCVLGHGLKSLLCGVFGYKEAGVRVWADMWGHMGGGRLHRAMQSRYLCTGRSRLLGEPSPEHRWLELVLAGHLQGGRVPSLMKAVSSVQLCTCKQVSRCETFTLLYEFTFISLGKSLK